MSALDVTKKLEALDPGIEVEHMGKTDLSLPTSRPLLLPMDGSGVRQPVSA